MSDPSPDQKAMLLQYLQVRREALLWKLDGAAGLRPAAPNLPDGDAAW